MAITLRATKGSKLSHAEVDANFTSFQESSGSSLVGFIQSGAGAVATTAQDILRTFVTPQMFGGVGDGVTDDKAAVLAASVAAVAQKKAVLFVGTWNIGSQIALTSAHTGLKWVLWGATIKKGFSGDLVANSGAQDFSIDGTGTIDGQHGTYTGKGFVFSTGNSDAPYFGPGIKFTSFTDTHIEFGVDAGERAKVYSEFVAGSGQASFSAIRVSGPDTTAMHRNFTEVKAILGTIILNGANNTTIVGGTAAITVDSNCDLTRIVGSSATFGTISGDTTIITGCRVAGDTTLDSGYIGGSFVGNAQTSGTFTDNSVGSLVLHENEMSISAGVNGVIQTGDATSLSLGANKQTGLEIGNPGVTAVTWLNIFGNITANGGPIIRVKSTQTNEGLSIDTKGAGETTFRSDAGGANQFQVARASSSVNYLIATGAASGANPSLKASAENILLGSGAALATTATAGHVMIPSCAGTPTGVPTGQAAGKIPMIFDTTGVKLWFYTGGAWKGVVMA